MKKISTKLNLSMLILTAAVLAFVGATLIISSTLDYYRAFDATVIPLLESDGFESASSVSDMERYLDSVADTIGTGNQRSYYILVDGNVVKSSATGGILKLTPNLRAVLSGGTSRRSGLFSSALDCARAFPDGVVYVIDNRSALRESIRDLSLLFLQAMLLGALLTLILSYVISKRLTASIKKLEDGARQMSEGNFKRVRVKTQDEIGNLCAVFNEMGEQIQRDRDESERTERSRREFVANVSHELKTPLTVIKSYSQTLNSVEVDDKTRGEFLCVIDSEVDRMNGIVGQLLQLSRLELSPPDISEVELDVLCSEILRALDISAREKELEITLDGQCRIKTDREKVKTIITNLCSNAVKYTEKGGHIKVTIENEPPSVTVTDDGIGISKEDIPHLFERFYRADKARGRETGGTGLGLAIAQECASAINARISARSGDGTTKFRLEF